MRKPKGKGLQQVVDHFNRLIEGEKGTTFTVEEVTMHDGKVYFPLKTGDTKSEQIRQADIIDTLDFFDLPMTKKFFVRGMWNDASTWVIKPESPEGQWILNSLGFQKLKQKIQPLLLDGKPHNSGFTFSPFVMAITEEWKLKTDIQLTGAIGGSSWRVTPDPETRVYELILTDDFNFEKSNRLLPLEYLTTLGREGDFTPFSIEFRINLSPLEWGYSVTSPGTIDYSLPFG